MCLRTRGGHREGGVEDDADRRSAGCSTSRLGCPRTGVAYPGEPDAAFHGTARHTHSRPVGAGRRSRPVAGVSPVPECGSAGVAPWETPAGLRDGEIPAVHSGALSDSDVKRIVTN